ncbi:hypothetical protein [Paenibacillus turpanensis]|uniref:hypothetical protein n=1 Tax=Paenibacillus turpanensis TaxID=2689078 RepID=UPI0014095262|nr:hypothetical protein [Paenibacillus turpanensis]
MGLRTFIITILVGTLAVMITVDLMRFFEIRVDLHAESEKTLKYVIANAGTGNASNVLGGSGAVGDAVRTAFRQYITNAYMQSGKYIVTEKSRGNIVAFTIEPNPSLLPNEKLRLAHGRMTAQLRFRVLNAEQQQYEIGVGYRRYLVSAMNFHATQDDYFDETGVLKYPVDFIRMVSLRFGY